MTQQYELIPDVEITRFIDFTGETAWSWNCKLCPAKSSYSTSDLTHYDARLHMLEEHKGNLMSEPKFNSGDIALIDQGNGTVKAHKVIALSDGTHAWRYLGLMKIENNTLTKFDGQISILEEINHDKTT